jgi:hypothetical protein
MYLENLSTEITREGNHIEVTYTLNESKGTCKYVIKPSMSKIQPGNHLLLVEVNMKDIIEGMNKIFPLKDEDLLSLQMEIREDSLNRITQWEGQGPYQS